MLLNLGDLNYFYDRLSICEPTLVRVAHEPFASFCQLLGRIRKKARILDNGDDKLFGLFSPFRRFGYDAVSAPIPFSSQFYDYLPEKIEKDRVRNELRTSYRELADIYDALLAALDVLRSSDDNPLLDKIASIGLKRTFPLVVRRQRYIEFSKQASMAAGVPAEVMLPTGVQPDMNFEIGIAVGVSAGPPEWFPESLRRVPMAKKVVFVEYDWVRRSADLNAVFVKPLMYTPLPRIEGADALQFQDLDEDQFNPAGAEGIVGLREYALKTLQGDQFDTENDRIPARLAIFENGWMAFLNADESARHNVVGVSAGNNIQIVRKRTGELEADDPVVLRLGGGGDYVEQVADKLLGKEAQPFRAMQRLWKRQLKNQVDTFATFELAAKALRIAGCSVAETQNIRNWLGPRSIGLGARSDWSALCRFIGIDSESEDTHWQSMKILRRTHVRAGNQIRVELLQRLKTDGISEFRKSGHQVVKLPDHEDISVILLSLIQVDEKITLIPLSRLERPFERD